MTTDFDIPLFLKNLPNLPGVYRFFDEGGNVLYVGKAVNLKRACPVISRKTTIPRASH